MAREAVALREAGADGLVFGVLDRADRVDRAALSVLMEAAEGMPVTFHRAFDEIAEPLDALEQLAAAGVRRVLTGGGPGSAWEGRERLRALVQVAAQHYPGVTILGAGSIRGDHARALVDATGLSECHARSSAFPALAEALGIRKAPE
jgi:copper homeostasis protein